MDIYCWAGVAVLLIIMGVSVFCLWSKSNTQDDAIRWLKDENDTRRMNAKDAERRTMEWDGQLTASLTALTKQVATDFDELSKKHDEDIRLLDDAAGLTEKRVADIEEHFSALTNDGIELFKSKNDHERRIDTHEKRLNDQMSHILGDEKRLAVLIARVDGQESAVTVSNHAIETLGKVYLALLAQGTFITVEPEPVKRAARRGKR